MRSLSSPAPAGRRFRGLSPEERQTQRRRQLIEAGLEVFGTNGFHASGVRDICTEAKLTERYFYESFDNREALFLAVYDDAVARIREAVVAAIGEASGDVDAMARAALRAYLEMVHAEPRLARIVLIDVFAVGADVGKQTLAATRGFADLIGDVVQRLYPELPNGLDGRLIADGLVGSTIHIVIQWASNGFKEPLERVLDHCALFYEATFEHTLASQPRKAAAVRKVTARPNGRKPR